MRIPSKRTTFRGLIGIFAVLFLYITTVFASHPRVSFQFQNGDSVQMKCASILESISEAQSEIDIRTSSRKEAHIVLYQDFFDCPVMVIPAAASNVFFCLYCNDVDFQLLKMDLNQAPEPFPHDSFVGRNVITSTCKIEGGLSIDWAEVSGALQHMAPNDYGRQVLGHHLLFPSLPIVDQAGLLRLTKHWGRWGQ